MAGAVGTACATSTRRVRNGARASRTARRRLRRTSSSRSRETSGRAFTSTLGAGRLTLGEFVETWLASQTFDISTRNSVRWRLNAQILPFFRNRQLGAIRPTDVRAWIRSMQERNVATSYQAGCFAHLSSILSAAVDDKLIRENPCHARTVVRPRPVPPTIVPWSRARVAAMRLAMAERYKIVMVLGAGCGLRQGELFGVSLDDLDREAGVLHVVRQVRVVDGRQVFALPKRNKTRDVPLARSVLLLVDEHLARFEPVAVTLPWRIPSGEPTTVRLIADRRERPPDVAQPLQRSDLESRRGRRPA